MILVAEAVVVALQVLPDGPDHHLTLATDCLILDRCKLCQRWWQMVPLGVPHPGQEVR